MHYMILILIFFIIIIFEHTINNLKNENLKIDECYINDSIINSHNYTYTLNPEKRICYDQNVNILIYIHSSPKNFKYRQFVRETWSNRVLFPNIRTVFMMGLANDSQVNNLLVYEYNEYGDIVQKDFLDTYRNLTIKALMALKWIKDYCPNINYIVKLDEDVLMNTFALLDYVDELKTQKFKIENTIMCYTWSKAVVQHNNTSKWFVTYDEINADIYLDYCAGAAFILTPDLAPLYFNLSQYVKFFWIDDYYITGQIRSLTNTTLISITSKFIMKESSSNEFYTLGNQIIFGHFTKRINEFYRVWQKILQMNNIKLSESKILRR
jgi:beta-1,3-galactosyltransferase 1